MLLKKKAQVQITFNWIYVLVAGMVILLFFVSIVVKQKAVAEERLSSDLLDIMESIFTGAAVSESTQNFIDTSGLKDYTFYFSCEDFVTEYGIKGSSAIKQDTITPIFSPSEINTEKLILWSLPYKLPYKITDLLIATSVNSKYFVFGDFDFSNKFLNVTKGFNIEYFVDPNVAQELQVGNNFQVRIVDLAGNLIKDGEEVSSSFHGLGPDKVTAVSFKLPYEATYYRMSSDHTWKKIGDTVKVITTPEERESSKYAAIFAANDKTYKCNMQKVFQRGKYIDLLYLDKFTSINDHYDDQDDCKLELLGGKQLLAEHLSYMEFCEKSYLFCSELVQKSIEIRNFNDKLREEACIRLY